MKLTRRHLIIPATLATLFNSCLLWSSLGWAQGLPSQPGSSGFGSQEQQQEEKPAGPAEAAPEEGSKGEDLKAYRLKPWERLLKNKMVVFQLNGYLRFRADFFHRADLGVPSAAGVQGHYYEPLTEHPLSTNSCDDRYGNTSTTPNDDRKGGCPGNTLGGANMRLRLEPIIQVSDYVKVHSQWDILDNLVLGSTPDGLSGTMRAADVPLTFLSGSQAAPVVGKNTTTPAILVKRAWAEVGTPVGVLKFGRMPWHWGLGMLSNDGSCWDCNFGDNADRIMFTGKWANHEFSFGYEFAASGPSSLSTSTGLTLSGGQAIDLEQLDDVDQLLWVAGRIDDEETLRERVAMNEWVFNYGLFLRWRSQVFDYAMTDPANNVAGAGIGSSEGALAQAFVSRNAWAWIPDLWFKMLWRRLHLEAEWALIGGKINNVNNDPKLAPAALSLLQFGWVMRSNYSFLKDRELKVGLEVGMASGDQNEASNFDVNRRRIYPLLDPVGRDTQLNEFRFNYDYHVDLLLFREILGTVANAMYFKPSVSYDFLDTFGARLDFIYSVAHKPVAFPGNSPHLGFEIDLDLSYRNSDEGFSAGLQYGLLIPFDALDRPERRVENGQLVGIFPTSLAAGAKVAQTLQARLMVKW